MKLYFYFRKNGQVTSYSDVKNQSDLPYIELRLTHDEEDKIGQGYEMWINDGKLEFIKPQRLIDDEKKQAIEDLKQKLKQKGKSAKIEDVIELLTLL